MNRAAIARADYCDCCDKTGETFDDRDPFTDDIRGHLCGSCTAAAEMLDGHIHGVEFFAAYLARYSEYRTWL